MATINVSNSSQLSSALSAARGGETIILANGSYGDLTISQDYAGKVTLQAANDLGASFGKVKITGSNVKLDGVSINSRFTISNADNVDVVNSLGKSWNEVLNSSNVAIENNEFTNTLSIEQSTGFSVTGNYIHEVAGDLLRIIGNSSEGVVENNVLWDMIPKKFADGTYIHADALQMFSNASGTPHDIVIRGNHVYDDPATGDSGNLWGQGIFLGGPTGGYRNITIEDNLVDTGSPNAIYMSTGVEGNVIRNNTVLSSGTIVVKTGDSSGTVIYDNVVKKIIAENGAVVGDNFFYINEAELQTGEFSRPTPSPAPTPAPAPEYESAPAPAPEFDATPAAKPIDGAVFSLIGSHEIAGAKDVLELAHDPNLALPAATMALSFNANTVSGSRGLLSKDAGGYGGGGNHFTSYIENGTLFVRFQDGSGDKIFTVGGIQSNVEYDLQVSFGNGKVTAMLNGSVFGQAAFETSWETNAEFLQVGANGWASNTGKSGFTQVFDGTISNMVIVNGVQSYEGIQSLLAQTPEPAAPAPEPAPAPAPEPAPAPTPEPAAPTAERALFTLSGDHDFASNGNAIEIAPPAALQVDAATLSFTFNADTVSGMRGLVSKDASGYTGGGNHFTSYIEDGVLKVRLQDGTDSTELSLSGIKASQFYDVQVSFGGGEAQLHVNGALVEAADTDTSWVSNAEYLQIGANGWASGSGEAGYTGIFAGTISDVVIFGAGPDPEPAPEPIDPGEVSALLTVSGDHEFASRSDVIEIAPSDALEVDAATIGFTFNADTVSGRRGLVSKDARGDGDHFSAYIKDGALYVRYQDGIDSTALRLRGIEAGQDYDVVTSFGGGEARLYVNDRFVGSRAIDTNWTDNVEYLQIGALGWGSDSGEARAHARTIFDGTISDLVIFDEVLTADEVAILDDFMML